MGTVIGCACGCGCVTGIWLLELTGFGFSLEHPTVTETMISTVAKTKVLAFLSQARKRFSALRTLMRVMVVASCRRCGTLGKCKEVAFLRDVDLAAVTC